MATEPPDDGAQMQLPAMSAPQAHRTLDARGLKCPLPVLRARKAMKTMASGEVLMVLADDPAAPKDFRAFCAQTGAALLDLQEAAGVATLRLRVP